MKKQEEEDEKAPKKKERLNKEKLEQKNTQNKDSRIKESGRGKERKTSNGKETSKPATKQECPNKFDGPAPSASSVPKETNELIPQKQSAAKLLLFLVVLFVVLLRVTQILSITGFSVVIVTGGVKNMC